MSAAANAAGYLYAQGRLPIFDLDAQAKAQSLSLNHTAQPRSSGRLGPRVVPQQGLSQPVKQVRAPRIEYRKRRYYPLPSAA